MGSRTRVLKIGQNVWQLAQCFHIPAYNPIGQCVPLNGMASGWPPGCIAQDTTVNSV